MKKWFSLVLFFSLCAATSLKSQVQIDEAIDFSVKTLESEIFDLYPKLDEGKIVVINFFSTSCGPCQTFAHDFQVAYENFGENQGNVYFHGINYNGTNYQVAQFADIYQLFMPLSSGLEGGGNAAFDLYENYIWEPTAENITNALIEAGGVLVGNSENAEAIQAHVFPNPATDYTKLAFNIKKSTLTKWRVYNSLGIMVEQNEISAVPGDNIIELATSNFTSGTYFVIIEAGDKLLYKTTFMVQ
jgi:thiol-disulfide isomerase/thioredoxin